MHTYFNLQERRGEGTDTGTYGGEDLFECDPNCAVYVSMDKISQILPVDAPVVDATVSKPPSPPLTFKIDDQVVMVDKHGTKVKGKVRWIGKHEKIDVLGIEAVSIYYILYMQYIHMLMHTRETFAIMIVPLKISRYFQYVILVSRKE